MKSRRIYTSGGSQVLAVPSDWYDEIKKKLKKVSTERDNIEVLIRRYGDLLLILPPFETKKRETPAKIEVKNHEVMECTLKSYYMFGRDKVMLKISPDDQIIESKLKEISNKLYGMNYVRKSKEEIIVDFTPPDVPITELLDREFNLYNDMRTEVSRCIEGFTEVDEPSSGTRMNDLENDLDKTSYQSRRVLVKSLYEPEFFLKLGIENLADILAYFKMELNLERLGDLQKEIYDAIQELKSNYLVCPVEVDPNPFNNFYRNAHELVVKAYKERESKDVAYVIRSKKEQSKTAQIKTAHDEHEELIQSLTKSAIPNILAKTNFTTLKKNQLEAYAKTIRDLCILESRIDGMVGNASNIAESWYFRHARD